MERRRKEASVNKYLNRRTADFGVLAEAPQVIDPEQIDEIPSPPRPEFSDNA